MKATTNKLKNRNGSDLGLYILPFRKAPCFKMGITYDIYDRGSQLGFANFDWTSGFIIQATESHTIAGIESFLKKHLWAFRPKEIPRLSSGNTEIYTSDVLTRVISIIESFSSMPFLGVRITKGIAIDAIFAQRMSASGARGGQINKAVVNGCKRRRPETAFFKFGKECRKTLAWLRALDRKKAFSIMGPLDQLWAVIVLDRSIDDFECGFDTRYRTKGGANGRGCQNGSALVGDFTEIYLEFEHVAPHRFRQRLAKYLAFILPNVVSAVRSRSQQGWPHGFSLAGLEKGSEEICRMAAGLGMLDRIEHFRLETGEFDPSHRRRNLGAPPSGIQGSEPR
jgi:hypothetical protein